MLQAVHHVRGRLRVHHPEIKGDRHYAARYCDVVRSLPGVYAVSARAQTGSVVIEYDWRTTSHEELLQLLGAAPPGPVRRAEKMVEKLGQVLMERLLERSASALIGALI